MQILMLVCLLCLIHITHRQTAINQDFQVDLPGYRLPVFQSEGEDLCYGLCFHLRQSYLPAVHIAPVLPGLCLGVHILSVFHPHD